MHGNVLNRWKKEAIQNLSQLFVDDRKGISKMKKDYEQQIEELYAEVGKLTTQLSWIKKNLATNRSRAERIDLLDWDHPEHSIVDQAKLLSLNRSGLYYKPVPPSPEEIYHFTSSQYIDLLTDKDIRISMDGKRRAVDNIVIERFWRSLKYNEVYLNDYTSPRETR